MQKCLLQPDSACGTALAAKRMGGFLLCPIFSVRFLQVAILCHNPVTTAALFEFDILMYSLHGSMKL